MYVELHSHSYFSFLRGASSPAELVQTAVEQGHDALALTDTTGLYGAVQFYRACQERGLRAILGAEIALDEADAAHLVLLARDAQGYANLSTLLSRAAQAHPKNQARVTWEMLDAHSTGLFCLSGCVHGALAAALARGDSELAARRASRLAEIFGRESFHVELWDHRQKSEAALAAALAALAARLALPVVATGNVHYARASDRKLCDVLFAIRHHTTVDAAGRRLLPNDGFALVPPGEMERRFAHLPEAIAATRAIADACTFDLASLCFRFPPCELPAGQTAAGFLRQLAAKGAARRYASAAPELRERAMRQIEHELAIIEKLDLAGYFLIVWDIVRFCREKEILCQGRGSAANSAVCYSLGITAVDPVRLELLFERFLSEDRREAPDIDLDIEHERREEVLQYVYERYGRNHAGMVAEVISYRGRSAVRDVGKALGFSPEQLEDENRESSIENREDSSEAPGSNGEGVAARGENRSSRSEKRKPGDQKRVASDEKLSGGADSRFFSLDSRSSRVRELRELSERIQGFPRHLGIHVGGMIITEAPLCEIVPIENATMPGRTVIQWDKDDVADCGLVKIDLLGLGMLSLISRAIRLLKVHHGVTLDPALLTYDDPAVYDLLCAADTVGVFQVESRAQMVTLPRMKPRCFYDLVVEVALIRPGPIQGDMVHPYLRRRAGEEPVTYPHECLRPALERTLGVPLFQEQGMRVAIAAAGFSAAEADELRRAMGHKRSRERMAALAGKLIGGMAANGIALETARRIYKQLEAFSDYGFPESHAASFALLVYVSAHLKKYWPAEFACAILNAQPMGFYSPATLLEDARRHGVVVRPVDLARSSWECTLEPAGAGQTGACHAVRLGLAQVKGLGEAMRQRVEAELAKGRFRGLEDVVERAGFSAAVLQRLASIGAFRGFGLERREALWRLQEVLARPGGLLRGAMRPDGRFPLPEMNASEAMVADYRATGVTTGPHPMRFLRAGLARQRVLTAARLATLADGRPVRVAGVVTARQRPPTAKGFLFITLEDETGFANIVAKPWLVEKEGRVLCREALLVVDGVLEEEQGVRNVIARHAEPLAFPHPSVRFQSRDFR
ncbi:MAG: DNA polymerase III subunit alpha [Candidatus Wallbacteria bacterium]|nr:DNA polymerase III subunit alpha [Candidatus Wallbacteria bacterium]